MAAADTDDYRWALSNHLLPFFAEHQLSEITIEEVDRYRTAKVRQGTLSPSSVNKTITRLAQVLETAVEYGLLRSNPARGRRRRLKASAPKRRWLTPDQLGDLLEAAGRNRVLLATAGLGGLRVSELLALRWRDVDLAGGTMEVVASKTDAGGRVVDLSPELRDELAVLKAKAAHPLPTDLVFPTAKGTPQSRSNVRSRILLPAIREANRLRGERGLGSLPDVTMHDLRRTFVALLFEAGATVPYVMAQVGHTDPKVTLAIYAEVLRRSPEVGARLDALVRSSSSTADALAGTTQPHSQAPTAATP